MLPVFAASAITRPPRVLVFQLVPFQLGHALLMESLSSPYMVGGPVERPDLALAAWICSRPASQAMDGVRSGRPSPLLMRAIGRACRRLDWQAADAAFSDYIRVAMMHPARWHKGAAPDPRAPWQWLYAVRLSGGDAGKLRAAWDTPMLDATAYLTACDAAAGDDSIKSEAEELAAEQLKAAS